MQFIFGVIIFIFGSAVGSFINVVADRYNTGLKWWRGSSFCFSCNEKLRAKDLFPIVSFLSLRGRCGYCRSKIPTTAFWVELLMGTASLLIAYKVGLSINFLILNSIFAILLLIAVYDLKHFIIPNSFLWILGFLSLLFVGFDFGFNLMLLLQNFISGLVLALPFLILFLVSQGRWIGLGDVKYIVVIGFLLGLANGVSAILLAFWIAAGFALFLLFIIRKNLTMKSEVPFGPFLSLGVGLSLFFGLDILHLNDFWSIL